MCLFYFIYFSPHSVLLSFELNRLGIVGLARFEKPFHFFLFYLFEDYFNEWLTFQSLIKIAEREEKCTFWKGKEVVKVEMNE